MQREDKSFSPNKYNVNETWNVILLLLPSYFPYSHQRLLIGHLRSCWSLKLEATRRGHHEYQSFSTFSSLLLISQAQVPSPYYTATL